MMPAQELTRAVRRIAWGYVLTLLNVNIGTLNLLPDWLGYLLMLSALTPLSLSVPTAALLRRPAMLLIVWEALAWVYALFGAELSALPLWRIAAMIVTAVSLYFHFRLLSDIAHLAAQYDCPQTAGIRRARTAHTLLITVLSLPLPWEREVWLLFISIAAALLVMVLIIAALFSLHRTLADGETDTPMDLP